MSEFSPDQAPAAVADNQVAAFQVEGAPARGRILRLGAVADEILSRHAYPEPVANLFGEALALGALIGASLKFEGRLIVQAQGDGPVSYLVVDYDTTGALRGYCRYDEAGVQTLSGGFTRPGAAALLGTGAFVMTIDMKDAKDRYQGITPIEGETLALSAERYFAQSEQTPTRVRLAVSRGATGWRVGGLMIQSFASDLARGDAEEGWRRAESLFETVGEDELTDETLGADRLLYRLFHEDGVRLFEPRPLHAFCRCSMERVGAMLQAFEEKDREDMRKADGSIHVTCEYCGRIYDFKQDQALGAT